MTVYLLYIGASVFPYTDQQPILTADVNVKNAWMSMPLSAFLELELGANDQYILDATTKISMCCKYNYCGLCSIPCQHECHKKKESVS